MAYILTYAHLIDSNCDNALLILSLFLGDFLHLKHLCRHKIINNSVHHVYSLRKKALITTRHILQIILFCSQKEIEQHTVCNLCTHCTLVLHR